MQRAWVSHLQFCGIGLPFPRKMQVSCICWRVSFPGSSLLGVRQQVKSHGGLHGRLSAWVGAFLFLGCGLAWAGQHDLTPALVPVEEGGAPLENPHDPVSDDALPWWVAEGHDLLITTTTAPAPPPSLATMPSTVLSGESLQRRFSLSVPMTLESVPGFHVQYNGPGASGATIRGLPGDRVLMLEDGHGTGDIAWSADDHGVMVEVLTAERVDVIRGPGGLLYGANALGGVVNVVRDDVPTHRLPSWEGRLVLHGETVHEAFGGAAVARGPLGPLSLHTEVSGRVSGDTQTPEGRLEDTGQHAFGGAVGASVHPDWGRAGMVFRLYSTRYEVPGEFQGEMIPGGHPGGVAIEVDRYAWRGLTVIQPRSGTLESLEISSSVVHFRQDEIEGTIQGSDVLGARFEQTMAEGRVLAQHTVWPVADGLTLRHGASVRYRGLQAGGSSPGVRSGRELDAVLMGLKELVAGAFRLHTGLRLDLRHAAPDDLRDMRVRTDERTIQRSVEPVTLPMVSASMSLMRELNPVWLVGLTLSRASRPPNLEELYSDGPHLADFSYDIGNPSLRPEVGHGVDLFVRAEADRFSLETAVFANWIQGYIFYNPTGEEIPVFRDGVETRNVPVYEARGDDALFVGGEGQVAWEMVPRFFAEATVSYTAAERLDDGDPLPWIPPLSSRFELRYEGETLYTGSALLVSAMQSRVPRPIVLEDAEVSLFPSTPGHALVDVWLGARFSFLQTDHVVHLQVRNVADTAWRDHLSRIRTVAPQPGRSAHVSWTASF